MTDTTPWDVHVIEFARSRQQRMAGLIHGAPQTPTLHMAIDDFSTGYSSLSYLKRFPVDVVKVDRLFVAGLGKDAVDSEIVTAVIRLAAACGITTIAEGVETLAQLRALGVLGVDSASGYLLARPTVPEHLPMVPPVAAVDRPQLHPSVARVPWELQVR